MPYGLLGSPEPEKNQPSSLIPLSSGVAHAFSAIDDLNGDGLIDFALSTKQGGLRTLVYFGNQIGDSFELNEVATLVGVVELANVGDVNGDGFGDLFASDPASGLLRIYLGSPGSEFDVVPDGQLQEGEGFGVAIRALPARRY